MNIFNFYEPSIFSHFDSRWRNPPFQKKKIPFLHVSGQSQSRNDYLMAYYVVWNLFFLGFVIKG